MKSYDDFFRVYSNLPLHIRKQVVLTIDGEPITWQVAYNEIKNSTKRGKMIYETLKKLKIV